jgi:hypothetical protein
MNNRVHSDDNIFDWMQWNSIKQMLDLIRFAKSVILTYIHYVQSTDEHSNRRWTTAIMIIPFHPSRKLQLLNALTEYKAKQSITHLTHFVWKYVENVFSPLENKGIVSLVLWNQRRTSQNWAACQSKNSLSKLDCQSCSASSILFCSL